MTSIKVFSQPTCLACNELKDHLKKKGVDFVDMDVTANREALDEMIKVHKVRVAPLLLAGDKRVIGFDPLEVDKVLAELR
jgi:glutaredoxin